MNEVVTETTNIIFKLFQDNDLINVHLKTSTFMKAAQLKIETGLTGFSKIYNAMTLKSMRTTYFRLLYGMLLLSPPETAASYHMYTKALDKQFFDQMQYA